MDENEVQIPIQCPHCGVPTLSPYPSIVVVTALTQWKQMRLYVACHDVTWDASPAELERIQAYLGSQWLDDQRRQFDAEAFSLRRTLRRRENRIPRRQIHA